MWVHLPSSLNEESQECDHFVFSQSVQFVAVSQSLTHSVIPTTDAIHPPNNTHAFSPTLRPPVSDTLFILTFHSYPSPSSKYPAQFYTKFFSYTPIVSQITSFHLFLQDFVNRSVLVILDCGVLHVLFWRDSWFEQLLIFGAADKSVSVIFSVYKDKAFELTLLEVEE